MAREPQHKAGRGTSRSGVPSLSTLLENAGWSDNQAPWVLTTKATAGRLLCQRARPVCVGGAPSLRPTPHARPSAPTERCALKGETAAPSRAPPLLFRKTTTNPQTVQLRRTRNALCAGAEGGESPILSHDLTGTPVPTEYLLQRFRSAVQSTLAILTSAKPGNSFLESSSHVGARFLQ